jgi:hypothetical protein
MHFEGRLASCPQEIRDLFAELIQRTRTYTDDVWVPSDPGPENVPAFNPVKVERVLQDLDVNKDFGSNGIPPIIFKNHYHFLTGLWQ